jgi:hypothetical protein
MSDLTTKTNGKKFPRGMYEVSMTIPSGGSAEIQRFIHDEWKTLPGTNKTSSDEKLDFNITIGESLLKSVVTGASKIDVEYIGG